MTQDTINELSQKQRDRLAYIEFRLWFLGDACRRDREVDGGDGVGGEAPQADQHAAGGEQQVERRRREQRRDAEKVQPRP